MSAPKPTISNFEQHWFDALCARHNCDPKDPVSISLLLVDVDTPQQLQFLLSKGVDLTSTHAVLLLKRIAGAQESPSNLMILHTLFEHGGSDLVKMSVEKLNVFPLRSLWFAPKMLTVALKSGIDWSVFSVTDHKNQSTEMALISDFVSALHTWVVIEKVLSYPKAYKQRKDEFLASLAAKISTSLFWNEKSETPPVGIKKGVRILNKVLLVASEKQRPMLSDVIQKNLATSTTYSLHHQDGLMQVSLAARTPKLSSPASAKPLFKLIRKPNKSKADIEELMARKVDPNTITPRHQRFLEEAIRETNLAVCQKLLEAGANPNAISHHSSNSMLQIACQMKSLSIVKLLLNNGANPSYQAPDHSTPLFSAARSGLPALVGALHAKGVDMNVLDERGGSVLFSLAHLEVDKFIPMVHHLITLGANPFVRNKDGENFVEHVKMMWSKMHWKKDGDALGLSLDAYVSSLSAHDILSAIPSAPSTPTKRKHM